MMDCGKTEIFLHEWKRMCKKNGSCARCESYRLVNPRYSCISDEGCFMQKPEEMIKTVQEWSDQHPVKTRLSVFLETFPNAVMKSEDALPISCARLIFGFDKCEKKSCADCWNTPVEQGVQ